MLFKEQSLIREPRLPLSNGCISVRGPVERGLVRQGPETIRKRRPSVILVDDDELVLSSLRLLLEISRDITVLEFTDPLRAIQELRHQPVDLVISDYLMPGMNGIELLKTVRALRPEAKRILLTGCAGQQNGSGELHEDDIHQVMAKPWDNDHLLRVLDHVLGESDLGRQAAPGL